MAVNFTIANHYLSGLPTTVTARADRRSGTTFHRILLDVSVSGGGRSATFRFSSPTVGNEDVAFDLSSAFRAMTDNYRYEANVLNSYPKYTFTVQSSEEWMVDGEVHSANGSQSTQNNYFYYGVISDRSRLFSIWPSQWSTKPTSSPELCFIGQSHLFPGVAYANDGLTLNAPSVTAVTVPDGFPTASSGSSAGSNPNIYGIPAPADGYELRFINSMGVHENVFLTCLPTEETSIHTDQYIIARQETLTQFSRRIAIKKNNHERWHLSSPPLDRQWQQWYLHEVLTARWAWLNVSGHYLPVNILTEESAKGRNRQKAEPMNVEFDVEFDINGSPIQ